MHLHNGPQLLLFIFVVAQFRSASCIGATVDINEVEQWLSDHGDANLQNLIDFVAIPSVSSDHERAHDVRECAKWLKSDLADAGLENIEILETKGHPSVYADWLNAEDPDAPTVLIYGHYDVQPADPLELWTSPPFDPHVRDDKLYGRGASDDKGHSYVPIVAVKAYLKTVKKLPVNVKFLLEGEEEIGSPNLKSLLIHHADKLKADYAFSADGGMVSPTIPSLCLVLRGAIALELTVRVADRDMHSGTFGGGVQNPLHAMAHLLSTLHDTGTGKILVDGYYDDVDELTDEERLDISKFPITETDLLTREGVNMSVGEKGFSFYERTWARPTIEVVGMWGGFTGEGIKTVLPREAHAKIVARTVSSQKASRARDLIVKHLTKEAEKIPGASLEITPNPFEGDPFKMPKNTPGNQVAASVLAELYGREPVFIGMGGSIPVLSLFRKTLSIETTMFAFGHADENVHAPDEFARIESLRRGERAYVRLLQGLAKAHVGLGEKSEL